MSLLINKGIQVSFQHAFFSVMTEINRFFSKDFSKQRAGGGGCFSFFFGSPFFQKDLALGPSPKAGNFCGAKKALKY